MGHIHLYGMGNMLDRIGPGKILAVFRECRKAYYRDEKQQNQSRSAEYARQEFPIHNPTSKIGLILH
jgi:hypothetical protein